MNLSTERQHYFRIGGTSNPLCPDAAILLSYGELLLSSRFCVLPGLLKSHKGERSRARALAGWAANWRMAAARLGRWRWSTSASTVLLRVANGDTTSILA